MAGLRRVLVFVLATLLLFALLGGAYAASINRTLGDSEAVESTLRESRVYDEIASYAITRAIESTSTPSGSISLDNPKIKSIAESVFSKQLVQQNAETFINSNYRWLDGETEKPEFTIDLSASKAAFAKQVNETVLDYLSKLPVCTPAQLTVLLSAPVDPLTVTCLPSTVVPKAEADRITSQILTSDFLAQPVVTAETLKVSGVPGQDEPYYVKLSSAPKVYQKLQITPLILGLVAVVAALGVVLFSRVNRKGVLHVGLVLMLAGLVLIATKFVADTLFDKFQSRVFQGTNDSVTDVQKPLIDAAQQLQKQIVTTDLYIGLVFVLIALLLIALYYKMRSETPIRPSGNAPAPTTTTTANKPRPSSDSGPTRTAPITKPGNLRLARPGKGPTMDIARPSKQRPQTTRPPANDSTASDEEATKKQPPRPRRPLVQ